MISKPINWRHGATVSLLLSSLALVACGDSDDPVDEPPSDTDPDTVLETETETEVETELETEVETNGDEVSETFGPIPDPARVFESDGTQDHYLETEFLGAGQRLSFRTLDGGVDELLFSTRQGSGRSSWRLDPIDGGGYRIIASEIDQVRALDVVNDGVFESVQLVPSGAFTGQYWTVTPLDNGYCRLTNEFLGAEIALDVTSDGAIHTPTLRSVDSVSGQHWRIMPIDGGPSACDGVAG